MSEHWRPEGKVVPFRPVRRGSWTRPSDYGEFDPDRTPRVVPVVLGAVLLGFIAAGVLSWTAKSIRAAAPLLTNARSQDAH